VAGGFTDCRGAAVVATNDAWCMVAPYFKVHPGKLDAYKALCEKFVERASTEPKCLYYGFTFNGDEAFCREGYVDAEAVLLHLQNVKDLLIEARKFTDITRFEIHGPETELAKLREPLSDLNVEFFTFELGFRR
jgi:hypothetical protein